MFEKTLTDVVKGIRASKRDTALYISQCLAEIKAELQDKDMFVKANALQKLTFLQMMGYSMQFSSFATIEVMSSPRFAHKRIGYLAASQGFTQDTEVILLCTNLLQKELRAANISSGNMQGVYEAGLAINCISNIVTPELAADLLPELTQLTSHSQPYLRKKAILCLFKLFVQYPEGLRLTIHRLQECLADNNPAVVSCAVNVITELSDKQNPKNYLNLAPQFFDLLTKSSNNWMLIKVVKLLGSLVPHEPRLARKLLEPLADIVQKTQAKSLLYEAVHTITLCLPYCRRKSDGTMPAIVPQIVQLSASTLKSLVQEDDQNLKYLGLVGFASLQKSQPRVLQDTKDGTRPLILACLSDPDTTIRTRALDLLPGLATRKNVVDLIQQLLPHAINRSGGSAGQVYRQELVARILQICALDKYHLLTTDDGTSENRFQWYFDVLLQLGHLNGMQVHATAISLEVMNVALRVLPVRTYAVQRSLECLLEQFDQVIKDNHATAAAQQQRYSDNGRGKNIMGELLPALAWIVGEYSDLMLAALQQTSNQRLPTANINCKGHYHAMIYVLSLPWNVPKLPASTQKVYLQAVPKVFAAAAAAAVTGNVMDDELEACLHTIQLHLPIYMQSVNVEVVERAFTTLELLRALELTEGASSTTAAPGLIAVEEVEEEDSEDDDNNTAAASGVLLGSDGRKAPASTSIIKAEQKQSTSSASPSSLAFKIRTASATLNHLYKPSPMKPAGNKAQRKKRNAPIGHSIDLDAPLDLSVLSPFWEQETAYLQSAKLSMESVSFTQQRPMQAVNSGGTAGVASMATFSPVDAMSLGTTVAGPSGESFQNPALQQQQRQKDPFYLGSSPSHDATAGLTTIGGNSSGDVEDAMSRNNRLGIIQLPDDDEEDEQGAAAAAKESKKSKREKKKAAKQAQKEHAAFASASSTDFLSFGPHAAPPSAAAATVPSAFLPGITGAVATPPRTSQPATILVSDDDDDDDDDKAGQAYGRKNTSGAFAKLSKVDLTAPPKHEMMVGSARVHYSASPSVVPPASSSALEKSTEQKSKKELKKERKEAKKKKKEQAVHDATASSSSADLLDIFGDGAAPVATLAPASTASLVPSKPTSADAISSAFDDLLGFGAPLPAPVLPLSGFGGMEPQSHLSTTAASFEAIPAVGASGKSKMSRPWIKGSIKGSHATGTPVDWTNVRLTSRTYRSNQGEGTAAAMVVVRVENMTASDLVVDLPNIGSVKLTFVGGAAESSKVGPFVYPEANASYEVKGTLRWSSGSVPVKLLLPAALHLLPQQGLDLEHVAGELASESFASASAKVGFPYAANMDMIKQAICGFLRVAEVTESVPDPKTATFAASSSSGAKVRVMAKLKDNDAVKMEIRSTDTNLANALASDLKKVLF